jgi:Zn-dependent peptidase ImmA (M78 family)
VPSQIQRDAWRQAADARGHLRLGGGALIPDLVRLLESGPSRLPVCILPLPDGVAGAYARRHDRSFLFVNRNDAPVRQRFTLGHEYGHHWMNHPPVVDLDAIISGNTRDRREIAANAFSAELLVPREALNEWLDARWGVREIDLEAVVRAASYFSVSASSIRYRLDEAGRLPKKTLRDALDEQIANQQHLHLKHVLGLTETPDTISDLARERGVHLPAEMQDLAFEGYRRGLVPIERLAESLHRGMADLKATLEMREIEPLKDDGVDW